MSRYIDADKIEKVIRNYVPLKYFMASSYNRAIQNGLKIAEILNDKIPTSDVVEVIRCKDCKNCFCMNDRYMCKRGAIYNDSNGEFYGLCAVAKEHFCSYGERR